MRVVLGGTFSPLHKGHKALFQRAFTLAAGGVVIVGLTSDSMAQGERKRDVEPYSERKLMLESYLRSMAEKYPGTTFETIEINEVFNVSITREREADVLVVSEGKKRIAEETNEHRKSHGMPPLEIDVVPYVLAQDGLPIKATRIATRKLDAEGRLLGKVEVAVGTGNDVKCRAVKNIFKKIYNNLEVLKYPVSSSVPAQPWGIDTILGAKNRAAAALEAHTTAHFGVGIEAGLFPDERTQKHFDVQYCAIQDRGGRITIGHGPGFYYPPEVVERLKMGESVGEAMAGITGVQNIGHKQGAIGYLTREILTREALTEQAVLMAMVPRLTGMYESNY